MTKLIMQQVLESIEAHAMHTKLLIESNKMDAECLYRRIYSIEKTARNALDVAKREEVVNLIKQREEDQ